MNFNILLYQASSHFRYQENLLKQMHFPEENNRYAFTLNGITNTSFHYPNGISLNAMPCFAFLYTSSGRAALHYDSQAYPLTADTTAWIDCSRGFRVEITETRQDWHFFLVFASGSTISNYYEDFLTNEGITISSKNSPSISVIFHQLYSNAISRTDYSPLIYSKLLCDLMTSLTLDRFIQSRYGEEPEHIIKVIHYIQEHYAEKITLDTIANHFAISKYSLSRDFTSYMNQSLIDYLIDYRIEESKKLLISTNLSVSEISFSTGFTTVNNFLQQFKKRTDLTPSAYRQQNQIYSSTRQLFNFTR